VRQESLMAAKTGSGVHLFDNWFDPIESGVRGRVREFVEALICGELDEAWLAHATGGPRRPTAVRQALSATGTAAARAR
jgi:hypothetical protein